VAVTTAVLYTDKNFKSVWWVGNGQNRDYRLVEMHSVDGIVTKSLQNNVDEKTNDYTTVVKYNMKYYHPE